MELTGFKTDEIDELLQSGENRGGLTDHDAVPDIKRCRREIAEIERLLRSGHPDVQGLCPALAWASARFVGI